MSSTSDGGTDMADQSPDRTTTDSSISSFHSVSLANGIPEFVPREIQQQRLQDQAVSMVDATVMQSSVYGTMAAPVDAEDPSLYMIQDPMMNMNISGQPQVPNGNVSSQIMPSYYNQLNSIPVDVGSRHSSAGVVSVVFDHHEQLIWQGNSVGHVTSYFGPQLRKFSSFQVHQSHPIRQIETVENAVISLTQNAMRVTQRGGMTLFDSPFYDCDLQCMLLLDQSNILLGGHQTSTLFMDLNAPQNVTRIPNTQSDIVLMRYSDSNYFFGHSNGSISVIDPNTLNPTHCLQSHTGSLSDFSVSGNSLISCGFSAVSDQMMADSFVNVFDIRNFRLIFSHQFNVDPFMVRFFPMYNNRAMVLSQLGQFQIVDPSGLAIPESLVLHKIALPSPDTVITSCDLSSTSHAIVFGDSSGLLQLYGDSAEPTFNEFENPTEFPNPPATNMYVSYDDYSVPFSSYPLPITAASKPLLSEWPAQLTKPRYYDPPKIPEEISKKIEYVDFIGYAPYPMGWVRNQVPYRPPEYLEHLPESVSSRGGSPLDENGSNAYPSDLPAMYHKVVSPHIPDPFQEDSAPTHKSSAITITSARCFPTIENNSINGYASMLMYAISYIEPLAGYIRSHLCKRELCLTCEVSCMFDTLKAAPPDYSFTPHNFLRVFCILPETTALGLVISEFDDNLNSANSYNKLLQSFNRFLLQQLYQDFQRDEEIVGVPGGIESPLKAQREKEFSPDILIKTEPQSDPVPIPQPESSKLTLSGAINKLMGLVTEQTSVCKCSNEISRKSINFTTPLIYPDLFSSGSQPKIYSFEEVVKYSLTNESTTQSWCNKCHKFQPTCQKKKTLELPELLSLNCQLDKPRETSFWKVQQKLARDPMCQSQLQAPNTTAGMCRFGNTCSRKDCKFRHEKDSDIQSNIDKFLKSGVHDFAWAPRFLKISTDTFPSGPENEDSETVEAVTKEYELVAAVLHVPATTSRGHVVSRVKINGKYYLVNDTTVNEIQECDFNKFNLNWMVPCVMFYKSISLSSSLTDLELPNPVRREFLSHERKLLEMNMGLRKIFNPIGLKEEFSSSDFIGLDMNIVSNCKQETDINQDGTCKLITSSESSIVVTRVVCFRGSKFDSLPSVPLIDDHTQSKETVVEYINKLPTLDIQGGKHLATFKQTFLKLKYLVSRKVTFIGHNIEKKLRMFNLYVPKEQIQDTAVLYRLSRHRTLSLKFLANYFGISYSRSDVLRDCFVSMQLYKYYLKITNEGKTMQAFRMSLQEIYNAEASANNSNSRNQNEKSSSPHLGHVPGSK